MKSLLTKLCWPVLKFFETGDLPVNYKKSHRVVLAIVGSLFLFLSMATAGAAYISGNMESFLPVVVFFCVGLVAVIVSALGTDSAVSKIWGNK